MGIELDKTLRDGLLLHFRHRQPDDILRNFVNPNNREWPVYLTLHPGMQYALPKIYPNRYSINDAKSVGGLIRQQYIDDDRKGVFDMMLDFAEQALLLRDNLPVIRYEQVLRWRDTTHSQGTLPFICAFLADCDCKSVTQRHSFTLNPILPTDNTQLNHILSKGMAENHFHLKGSTPSFLLSWISLMNDVTAREKDFKALDKVMLREAVQTSEFHNRPLRVLVQQAAAIRAMLYMKLFANQTASPQDNPQSSFHDTPAAEKSAESSANTNGSQSAISSPPANQTTSSQDNRQINFHSILAAEIPAECSGYSNWLQSVISSLKALAANRLRSATVTDYALDTQSNTLQERVFDIFAGEVRFQYSMFRAIIKNDKTLRPYFDLFYAYLLIGMRLRAELTQSNQQFGFANFHEYDNRKGTFLASRGPYEAIQKTMAAASILNDTRYRSLEARIVPKACTQLIHSDILELDRSIRKELTSRQAIAKLRYVLHIPKQPDPPSHCESRQYVYCRDDMLRAHVRKVASAVIALRESRDRTAQRICGIDACSNEADARPEVFAVEFRRLKAHQCVRPDYSFIIPKSLYITYHVGEDFPDIADGLRAVWEAVEFLEMRNADRIGHGLALGIDAEEWYESKQNRVFVTRQALLDNCAWMLEMLKQYQLLDTHLDKTLSEECANQFTAIYMQAAPAKEPDLHYEPASYIQAMQLRGDDPYAYSTFANNISLNNSLSQLTAIYPAALRQDTRQSGLHFTRRYNDIAIQLYRQYHFNPAVKKVGSEIVEFHIPAGYQAAISKLQKCLCKWIAQKGIGLETNPSSNVLIGNFNRYDKHPLVAFHDGGLFDEPDNPRMCVSINTDDQGVFETSLENEFALVARGLEQLKNPDGTCRLRADSVYQWLNHIREMGLAQASCHQTSGDAANR